MPFQIGGDVGRWWQRQTSTIKDYLNIDQPDPFNPGGERQKMIDAIDAMDTIVGDEDYLTMVAPEELEDFAKRGYGQDWVNTMFELQTDESAQQLASSISNLEATQTMSGLSSNKMASRARDKVEFGFARGAGKTLGNIMNQNEDAKARAQRTLARIKDEETEYYDYVDALNAQQQWAGEKMLQSEDLDQRIADYITDRQNKEAKSQMVMGGLRSIPVVGSFFGG